MNGTSIRDDTRSIKAIEERLVTGNWTLQERRLLERSLRLAVEVGRLTGSRTALLELERFLDAQCVLGGE